MPHQTRYIYIAQLAIPQSLEQRFTELYDNEHVPLLMAVPGVHSCARFKLAWSDTQDMPEYLAIYDVDAPDVPKSPEWRKASAAGQWPSEIRPHMTVRRHGMFERLKTVES
ncbi:MAG: hypothetical protein GEU91_21165 [Rhizobiales bacterium]|nr:hypothetical protein [Hyphomicrobiales bacterium]